MYGNYKYPEIYMIYRKSMKKLLKDYDKYKLIIDLINI